MDRKTRYSTRNQDDGDDDEQHGSFVLSLIEALKDEAVVASLSKAFSQQADVIADRVAMKFHDRIKELERAVHVKDERIEALAKTVDELMLQHDDMEQYSRRDNLRIEGIAESQNEIPDILVKDFANNHLGLDPPMELSDISRSHRVGKPRKEGSPRTLLVKFTSYNVRARVIRNRRKLKEINRANVSETRPKFFVNEDLTSKRMKLAYEARQLVRDGTISESWTWDGLVKYKVPSSNRVITATRLCHLIPKVDTAISED